MEHRKNTLPHRREMAHLNDVSIDLGDPAASRFGHASPTTAAPFNQWDGSAFAVDQKQATAASPCESKDVAAGDVEHDGGVEVYRDDATLRRVTGEKMRSLVRGHRGLLLRAPTSGDNGIQPAEPCALRRGRNRKRHKARCPSAR